jgi:acetyl-CoA carboxylase biotin carboxyl carrier protein
MSEFKIDGEAVRELANILDATGLSEIEYVVKDSRIRVVRTITAPSVQTVSMAPAVQAAPAPVAAQQAAAPADPHQHPGALKSPLVGTAYLASEPSAPPYVKVGDKVTAGQTLLIIEAMKVMNPIKAPKAGTVTQFFAKDSTPVEFNEVLLIIE